MRKYSFVVVLVTVCAVACGSKSPTSPSGSDCGDARGSMRATVDGVAWSLPCVSVSIVPGSVGVMGFKGATNAESVSVLNMPERTGTFPIRAYMGQVMMDTPPYGVLPYSDTTVQGPMGTVTVTSYSLTNNGGHVAGTFSFTARGSVTGGVKRVTGGSFDITFGKRQ